MISAWIDVTPNDGAVSGIVHLIGYLSVLRILYLCLSTEEN